MQEQLSKNRVIIELDPKVIPQKHNKKGNDRFAGCLATILPPCCFATPRMSEVTSSSNHAHLGKRRRVNNIVDT